MQENVTLGTAIIDRTKPPTSGNIGFTPPWCARIGRFINYKLLIATCSIFLSPSFFKRQYPEREFVSSNEALFPSAETFWISFRRIQSEIKRKL